MPSSRWPSTTSNTVCTRASCRLPPSNAWSAGSGCGPPFGLINDAEHHVLLFLDARLQEYPSLSFHPNDNRATVVIPREEFLRYLTEVGNSYEFLELY